MQLFAKQILVDQHGKAVNFKLYSLGKPHMRSLHLAWLSFMIAFTAWFSIPPLLTIISKELNIAPDKTYDSNIASVSVTIVARLVVGPLCERWGPRRVMAGLLICGAIPCAMTGLVKDGTGLIILRCTIGILGATFVPCQFWTTQMFAPSILGTANAITGGWGNMGGGITYLLIPGIYSGLLQHMTSSLAWRVTFIFPAVFCITIALLDLFVASDTPQGDWLVLRRQNPGSHTDLSSTNTSSGSENIELEKGMTNDKVTIQENESIASVQKSEPLTGVLYSFVRTLIRPSVLILICQYACSFGTELAIDNVIGSVFLTRFNLDTVTASYIGSIFGLLNICSRFSGGLFSDYLAKKFHLPGRMLAQLILMSLEGAFLIGFSFGLGSMRDSIVLMVFFSYFVQSVCGSTYAIVPFVDPINNGKVIGIIGAGGNFGGLVFNLMFKSYAGNFEQAFIVLGIITLSVGVCGCSLLNVQNKRIWHIIGKRYE
ncbi:major facilitator superfamily domain-containing protein [Halteromyces radiatus]|uniref:major facilitator superfamily domain-containing protein n=1 Tax=Halteromyces radiatus TaxID=101107 RepID=UPI002220034C|nr:major facilitator superfamily domain-containing protein [Halteromyces radiatus]KAI8079953.1 major facilitator superfamily domain-containing protein [Halteromyces radiatus]